MVWTLHHRVLMDLFIWTSVACHQSAGKFCIAAYANVVLLCETQSEWVNKGVEGAVTVESHSLRRQKMVQSVSQFSQNTMLTAQHQFHEAVETPATFWNFSQGHDITGSELEHPLLEGGTTTACLAILVSVKGFIMKLVYLTAKTHMVCFGMREFH